MMRMASTVWPVSGIPNRILHQHDARRSIELHAYHANTAVHTISSALAKVLTTELRFLSSSEVTMPPAALLQMSSTTLMLRIALHASEWKVTAAGARKREILAGQRGAKLAGEQQDEAVADDRVGVHVHVLDHDIHIAHLALRGVSSVSRARGLPALSRYSL